MDEQVKTGYEAAHAPAFLSRITHHVGFIKLLTNPLNDLIYDHVDRIFETRAENALRPVLRPL